MTSPAILVLASSSRYRRELLQRLGVPFESLSPDVDETRLEGESAPDLVRRLSERKAMAGAQQTDSGSIVIGSDQVATVDGAILGKSGSHERAVAQLRQLSGKRVTFYTGLCLFNMVDQSLQLDMIPFHVTFRSLEDRQIERYLRHEQPYDCAGSFRSEGQGITLFERMEGDDPTALVGLPLIRLTQMLAKAGVDLP